MSDAMAYKLGDSVLGSFFEQCGEGAASGGSWVLEYFEACAKNIAAHDPRIKAWAHVDLEAARKQAAQSVARHEQGQALSRIDGMPIGVKDFAVTADMPTGFGTGCQEVLEMYGSLRFDAPMVRALKDAGAVLMGKTTLTEFGMRDINETRNPFDIKRAPGSSSTGSAAAVGGGMIACGTGSQALGSLIRPASYCGAYGYKPSNGAISRVGCYPIQTSMSAAGVVGVALRDVVASCVEMSWRCGPHPGCGFYLKHEKKWFERLRPRRVGVAYPATGWRRTSDVIKEQFKDLVEGLAQDGVEVVHYLLGTECELINGILEEGYKVAWKVHSFEAGQMLKSFKQKWGGCLSDLCEQAIEQAEHFGVERYANAMAHQVEIGRAFDSCMQGVDVVLTPSATSEAPLVSEYSHYESEYQDASSLLGLPAVSMPVFVGECGLPVGLQLLGGRFEDQRLVRNALWLDDWCKTQREKHGG